MPEIVNPAQTTYYIAYKADLSCVTYGTTEPNQTTTTGLDSIDAYTDFDTFVAALLAKGVTYSQDGQ